MKQKKVKSVYCHIAPQMPSTGIVSNTLEAEKHGLDMEFTPTGVLVHHIKSGRIFFVYMSVIIDIELYP